MLHGIGGVNTSLTTIEAEQVAEDKRSDWTMQSYPILCRCLINVSQMIWLPVSTSRGRPEDIASPVSCLVKHETKFLTGELSLFPTWSLVRRGNYQYQGQPPSGHTENLGRYLLVTSLLISRNPTLGHFCIRHPDLRPNNIIVSRSPDSSLRIVNIIDWQHTSILPPFFLAGVPPKLQNCALQQTSLCSIDRPLCHAGPPPPLPPRQ